MSTLIINGSPKGQDSNTKAFIEQFKKGARADCDIRYVYRESADELTQCMQGVDTILFFMPLYVFGMPGGVMKLFEKMEPSPRKKLGFMLQYGFAEGHHAQYVKKYFEFFAARMQCEYLGTVVKGNAAGVSMMPERMNKALFAQLQELGEHYAQTGAFKQAVVAKLEEPYDLTKWQARMTEFMFKIGINKRMWHSMLRKNNALVQNKDRPFLD